MCVSKKDLAFYPEIQRGGEAQLVKLTKPPSVWENICCPSQCCSIVFTCVCVCACMCVCTFTFTASPPCWSACVSTCAFSVESLGCTSMRLEYHGFSRWSEALVKQSMRGWCHSPNRSWAICDSVNKKKWLDGQMNSVWGFYRKSYGSTSWRQIHWPVLVLTQTRFSSCLFRCVPFPLS